jgi:diguanylate cyclase (GGDEF)-like protein
MLSVKERKKLILKMLSTVLVVLIFLSIIKILVIYKDLFSREFIYTLFIKEVVFSIVSAVIVALLLFFILEKAFKKINKRALNYAFTDGLTGLYNRHYLEDFLEKFDIFQKENSFFAIAFIDIDKFKYINDETGHLSGDCILKCLANKLKSLVRDTDMLCRYGGEEFVIIYNEVSKKDIELKVEKIRVEIENSIFKCDYSKITISIGLSFGQKGDDINMVLKEADEALYMAKNDGRNCVKIFDK